MESAVLRAFERGPFLVPSAVEGAREGAAGDKFRVSGTKEMEEGAGANNLYSRQLPNELNINC